MGPFYLMASSVLLQVMHAMQSAFQQLHSAFFSLPLAAVLKFPSGTYRLDVSLAAWHL